MKKLTRWIAAIIAGLAVVAIAADELELTAGWTYEKNGRKRILVSDVTQYDVTGNGVVENVQLVSTNAGGDALVLGGVTDPGFAWFNNLDASNRVQIGSYDANTNFVAFLELRPGEKSFTWLRVAAPRALATTNAVKLDYVISDR